MSILEVVVVVVVVVYLTTNLRHLGYIYRQVIMKKNASVFSKANPISDTKDLWDRVRKLTGKSSSSRDLTTNITTEELNGHYSNISTDPVYTAPTAKSTVAQKRSWISEETVFRQLDTLKSTASGLDELPFWFLRLSARR